MHLHKNITSQAKNSKIFTSNFNLLPLTTNNSSVTELSQSIQIRKTNKLTTCLTILGRKITKLYSKSKKNSNIHIEKKTDLVLIEI